MPDAAANALLNPRAGCGSTQARDGSAGLQATSFGRLSGLRAPPAGPPQPRNRCHLLPAKRGLSQRPGASADSWGVVLAAAARRKILTRQDFLLETPVALGRK